MASDDDEYPEEGYNIYDWKVSKLINFEFDNQS